jgi:uncharacterized protein YjbJ (UPF0337 family)
MDEDRITGAAKELGGKVNGATGELVGDRQTQPEGKATELKGSAQNLYGQAKDTLSDAADQARGCAGDAFDRARERYPDAQRVYQRGNGRSDRTRESRPWALPSWPARLAICSP